MYLANITGASSKESNILNVFCACGRLPQPNPILTFPHDGGDPGIGSTVIFDSPSSWVV